MSRCLSFQNRIFIKPVVRFTGRLLIVAAAATFLWGAENTKKPISRERLFRAAEIGGLSSDEFIGIIKDFGVDFELNSEDRQSLSKAGVDEVVMAAIGANFRDPIKEKITQLTQGGPLAKDNIIGLLNAGAGSEIIEALVDKRGVSFAMTPQEVERLVVDERAQHRLHRAADEPPHVLDREAVEDLHPVLRGGAHALRARAAQHEEHLPEHRLDQVGPRDEAHAAKRAGEGKHRRAADDRAVEVEEGRRGQGCYETSGSVRVKPPARLASTTSAMAAISGIT